MKRKGFTLIELLVVVSIIALLVSILMPALGKAREQAKAVTCGMHVKQVLLALQMFAMDNAGATIPQKTDYSNSSGTAVPMAWDQVAAEYFATKQNDSLKGYLACPADKKPRERVDAIWYEDYQGEESIARSYMLNGCLENAKPTSGGGVPTWWSDHSGKVVKDTSVQSPAEVLWLIECHVGKADDNYNIYPGQAGYEGCVQGTNYWSTSWWPPSVKGYRKPYGTSNGGIALSGDQHVFGGNWGYIDGHVDFFRYNAPEKVDGNINHAYAGGPIYPFSWIYKSGMRAEAEASGYSRMP